MQKRFINSSTRSLIHEICYLQPYPISDIKTKHKIIILVNPNPIKTHLVEILKNSLKKLISVFDDYLYNVTCDDAWMQGEISSLWFIFGNTLCWWKRGPIFGAKTADTCQCCKNDEYTKHDCFVDKFWNDANAPKRKDFSS